MQAASGKSSVQLYRDCLRLVRHVAHDSPKAVALKRMVRTEFTKHAKETDPDKVEKLKFAAVRAMSNYLLLESTERDPVLKERVNKWKQR